MGNHASSLGCLLLIVGIRYFCFVKTQDLTPIPEESGPGPLAQKTSPSNSSFKNSETGTTVTLSNSYLREPQ